MSENSEILKELKALHEKLDQVLSLVEEIRSRGAKGQKSPKPKPTPLTQEEIDSYRAKFELLFEKWLSGQEVEVQSDLEDLGAEEIRRFADANNLNVTAKMPKEKVLRLIGARFRERKQLYRGVSSQNQLGS